MKYILACCITLLVSHRAESQDVRFHYFDGPSGAPALKLTEKIYKPSLEGKSIKGTVTIDQLKGIVIERAVGPSKFPLTPEVSIRQKDFKFPTAGYTSEAIDILNEYRQKLGAPLADTSDTNFFETVQPFSLNPVNSTNIYKNPLDSLPPDLRNKMMNLGIADLQRRLKVGNPDTQMVNGAPEILTPQPILNAGPKPVKGSRAGSGASSLGNDVASVAITTAALAQTTRDFIGCYRPSTGTIGPECDPLLQPGQQNSCAPFSANEFAEVVALETELPASSESCTGTLIGDRWVISAAHCVTAREAAADITDNDRARTRTKAILKYVGSKTSFAFERQAKRFTVHERYIKPRYGSGEHDLALIELDSPFPKGTYDVALLSSEISSKATLVGYGYTQSREVAGEMNMGWPPSVQLDGVGRLKILTSPKRTLFCFGDSGGPTFIGYNRGCDARSLVPEQRPRSIQGVISNYTKGSDETTQIKACTSSPAMNIENITVKEVQDWICETTGDEAASCSSGAKASLLGNVECGDRSETECFEYLGAVKISAMEK